MDSSWKWTDACGIDDQQKEKPKVRVRGTTHTRLCVRFHSGAALFSLTPYFPLSSQSSIFLVAGPDTVEQLTLSQVWVATLVIVSSLFLSALVLSGVSSALRLGPLVRHY